MARRVKPVTCAAGGGRAQAAGEERLARRALLVGLTGGIASGKTTVAAMLAERGAVVLDADQLAREIVRPGEPALAELVREFGPGALDEKGELDRRWLAERVFRSEADRRALNRITHPRIGGLLRRRVAAREAGIEVPLVLVVEAAVMHEAGWDRLVDEIVIVRAKQFQRVTRLMQRYGLDHARALARVRSQSLPAERCGPPVRHIEASGTLEETRSQVSALWPELAAAARQKFLESTVR